MLTINIGTTIPAGTAIMTGTPAGVGWFQNPQYSLKDGDVVEVEIQPIGVLRNKMAFV
jgi:2-keto-4-pentenoate hydratase/2-oxohepta-3-ene-1,7-dioic acid hydratase in catechol pathway